MDITRTKHSRRIINFNSEADVDHFFEFLELNEKHQVHRGTRNFGHKNLVSRFQLNRFAVTFDLTDV